MKQETFIGLHTVDKLDDVLRRHNPRNIFLVTGRASYEAGGLRAAVDPILRPFNVTRFCEFTPNPELRDIESGIKKYREAGSDIVVAIGGGSTIDAAKAINIFAHNEAVSLSYSRYSGAIATRGKPLVAIPSTAGSGTEATQYAVLYNKRSRCSLNHEFVLPDYAIVDPNLTLRLPGYITACTGIDALSQAVESYWCIDATGPSKEDAKKAITSIMAHLHEAVNQPTLEARCAMSESAFLAGRAINITKTTACHGIAPAFTALFGVPHGHAVGLTLAPMLLYNSRVTEADVLDRRGVAYVLGTIQEIVELLGADTAEGAAAKVEALMAGIGLATRLSEIGVKSDSEVDTVISSCFNSARFSNNPRLLCEQSIRNEILARIR